MKRLLNILLLIFLLTGSVLPGYATEEAQPFEWEVAHTLDTLFVRLPGNATTGYQWTWQVTPENSIQEDKSEYHVVESEQMAGAGGIQEFEFSVTMKTVGDAKLTLMYQRPWEDVPPAIAYEMTLWITEGGTVTVEEVVQTFPLPKEEGDVMDCPDCGEPGAVITQIIYGGDEEGGGFEMITLTCAVCGEVETME